MMGPAGSRPSVEAVLAGGELGPLVSAAVGSGVVPGADHDEVAEVGGPAVDPASLVVGVTAGPVTALDLAAAPGLGSLRDPLGLGEVAGVATLVERLGVPTEDGRDDPGLARESAGGAGGDGFARVEVRGFEPTHQCFQGGQHQDGGVQAAGLGELVGRVALDVLGERLAQPLGSGSLFTERSLGGLVSGGG